MTATSRTTLRNEAAGGCCRLLRCCALVLLMAVDAGQHAS
jgi:hypothetical protein